MNADHQQTMKPAAVKRTVAITGAANGIGRAMAVGLAADGWKVLAIDRDAQGLQDLAGASEHIAALPADLGTSQAIKALVAVIEHEHGGVDALINNAGIGLGAIRPDHLKRPLMFWEIEEAVWLRFLWLHATVPMLLTSALVGGMLKKGWGRIVNVTTSLDSMLKRSPYGPTKACSEAQASVYAYDLQGTGVTANVLTPGGLTDTKIISDEAGYDRSTMLRPEVMLPPLRYLLSDLASGQSGTRIVASLWPADDSDLEQIAQATAPVAWRTLATPIRMPQERVR